MNVIVGNQYQDLLTSSNIQIMKVLTGSFKVSEIANSFSGMYYQKIIIDATAIAGFPKQDVLKELASRFDTEKMILFLPPDNPPPNKFLSFLVSLNIYNFTDNMKGLLQLVNKSNSFEDVKQFSSVNQSNNVSQSNNNFTDFDTKIDYDNQKIILGIKNVTIDAGSRSLVYMLMKNLRDIYKKRVVALEVDKKDFFYYNDKDMVSISSNKLGEFFDNYSAFDIALIDLGNNKELDICSDIIYLIDPSLYRINELMMKNNRIFESLKGKKIVLNNSMLKEHDISVFTREAGISVYYTLPPLNDRINNNEINGLLSKLGLIEGNTNDTERKGLLSLFK